MKNIFYAVAVGIITFSVMSISSFYQYCITPHETDPEHIVLLQIHRGASLNTVCLNLKENGLISGIFRFKLLAKLKNAEHKIKSGEYSISGPISPAMLLDRLIRGKTKTYSVTIPEGISVFDIAAIVEKSGLASAKSIIEKSFDKSFVKSLGLDADSLEGFLFPDTYFLTKETDAEEILKLMYLRFKEVFCDIMKDAPGQTGLSAKEVIIIASMVEKETARQDEKPLIASVFLTRIKKGMRLECDPTVTYGIKLENPAFHGRLRKKHLRKLTAYNTYRIHGLPPGPICNPGIESIKAVLNPSETDYLFFVSKNNGTHKFSRTLKEHNRAVYTFQKKRTTARKSTSRNTEK